MDYVSFFKLQAKNLHKDFKTKKKKIDELQSVNNYAFSPLFFDVDKIILKFDLAEEEIENFSLMKAQHFISQLVGFDKWSSLISASPDKLSFAKRLLEKDYSIVTKEQITVLPLTGGVRREFIEAANEVFEMVLMRLNPPSPEKIREHWNAEQYIDEGLLDPRMLPISRDYALSLIDAFLVHYVIGISEGVKK